VKLRITYFDQPHEVLVLGEPVLVKPYQIIVWMSLAQQGMLEYDAQIPKFPAILDSGHNHSFSISRDHLVRWTGLQAESLTQQGKIRILEETIPLRSASLWLHGNRPYRMNVGDGIAVHPASAPRLPLLGLRAITLNKLQIHLWGDVQEVQIRTPRKWYWPF
jgi:hypothetical protein